MQESFFSGISWNFLFLFFFLAGGGQCILYASGIELYLFLVVASVDRTLKSHFVPRYNEMFLSGMILCCFVDCESRKFSERGGGNNLLFPDYLSGLKLYIAYRNFINKINFKLSKTNFY